MRDYNKNANYSVQIIEKLEGDERTERNVLNSQVILSYFSQMF